MPIIGNLGYIFHKCRDPGAYIHVKNRHPVVHISVKIGTRAHFWGCEFHMTPAAFTAAFYYNALSILGERERSHCTFGARGRWGDRVYTCTPWSVIGYVVSVFPRAHARIRKNRGAAAPGYIPLLCIPLSEFVSFAFSTIPIINSRNVFIL